MSKYWLNSQECRRVGSFKVIRLYFYKHIIIFGMTL